jgi:GntR family transcriptional regulator, carbon starvation induced regulator
MGNAPVSASDANGRGLVDRVYQSVREAILSGVYAPASRLLATTIADDNGVSSIPVREALRRLETERLVTVELNRGATVAPISVEDMLDIYETRIVLECHALRRAYPELSATDIHLAKQDLGRMTRLLKRGRNREAYEHHRDFHYRLYEPSNSPWTMHLIRQLWVGAERYLRLSAGMRDTPEEFAAEHEAVLAAVQGGDVNAAIDQLEKHLRRTGALLKKAYGSGAAPALADGGKVR